MRDLFPSWLSQATTHAIVGFGREGQSTYSFLRKYCPNTHVVIIDERSDIAVLDQDEHVTVIGGADALKHIPEVDVLWKAPGIPKAKLQIPSSVHVTSQADLFFQIYGKQVVAVTGTKGKSTTAYVLHELLTKLGKHSLLVGNIGTPALDCVEDISAETVIVFEISAFQCESLTTASHTSVVTSLYQDHLDYYLTKEQYYAAKRHMLELQSAQDICLYRADNSDVVAMVESLPVQKIPYAGSPTAGAVAWIENNQIQLRVHDTVLTVIDTNHLHIQGNQNQVNCLPALIVAAQFFGASGEQLGPALASIAPLPGRLELVATVGQVRFYDDALATIPEATIAALDTLGDAVRVLIAGGQDRHQDYTHLAQRIMDSNITTVVLFPQTGDRIRRALEQGTGAGKALQLISVSTMHDAVLHAFAAAQREMGTSPIVLLSAGAPSFGVFANYTDRSAQYTQCIAALPHQ